MELTKLDLLLEAAKYVELMEGKNSGIIMELQIPPEKMSDTYHNQHQYCLATSPQPSAQSPIPYAIITGNIPWFVGTQTEKRSEKPSRHSPNHNLKERYRRESIRRLYKNLHSLLPYQRQHENKMSSTCVSILKNSVEYMQELEDEEKRLGLQLEREEAKKKARLSNLKKLLGIPTADEVEVLEAELVECITID